VTLATIDDPISVHHEPDPHPLVVVASPVATGHPFRAALATFAALIAAFAAFLFAGSGLSGQREQIIRDREFRSALAIGKARIGGAIPVGTPVAILRIPSIGLRQVVAEGSTAGVTQGGPGHVRATPMPGQAGNSVVLARRSTFGGAFGSIGSLGRGDRITVTTGQGRAVYRVASVGTLPADDAAVFATTSREGRLTLLTADPPLSPTRYLVARATLVGTPAASTPHVRTIARAETGLTGEGTGLLGLVAGLVVLLGAGAVGTWLFLRWRPWSAYIVVVPVVIAGAWITFEAAARFLPATL
jgi:LPXTG-site transpeptidase (sortase) family protein